MRAELHSRLVEARAGHGVKRIALFVASRRA
jgi:hypothetical protein